MPDNIQRLIHLSQREGLSIPLEGVGSIGGRLLMLLFLERRVFGSSLKEIDECAIQMPQGLLDGDRRDTCKPRGVFLESRQQSRKIVIVEALSMLFIGGLTGRESPIVDKADTSERLSQHAFLFIGRIEPEFVGALRLLAHGLFALSLLFDVLFHSSQHFAIERAIVLFGNLFHLLQ